MTYCVEIFYSTPRSQGLDDRLEQLANGRGGVWVASGTALVGPSPQRDIEFNFDDASAAALFVEAAERIPGVTVSPITVDD